MTAERSPIFSNGRSSREPLRDPVYRGMRMVHELARFLGLGAAVDMETFGSRIAGTENAERSLRDARHVAEEELGVRILSERDDDGRWLLRFDRQPDEVEYDANEWLDDRFGIKRKSPEELAERKAFRARLRGLGLCQECKSGPLYPGSPYCPEHRERRLRALAFRKAKLKRRGLCLWCSDAPAAPGHTLCEVCLEIGRQRSSDATRKILAAGLCQGCRRPRDREGVYCRACIEEQRRRKAERPAGSCSRCRKAPARLGFKMCEECTRKSGLERDKYRAKQRASRVCSCNRPLLPGRRVCDECVSRVRRWRKEPRSTSP